MNINQKGVANIILVVVILAVLVGAVGYFAFVKKSEPIAQQPTPTTTQTPTLTTTQKNETANWKTYNNGKDHFSFSYPQNWSLADLGNDNLLLKNESGKEMLHIAPHLRNLDYDYQNTLEKDIKSFAGRDYMGVQKVENVLLEKIVDSNQTLGYLSQWKIFGVDRPFIETRSDFESKLEQPFITPTGKYKTVFSLLVRQDFNDPSLFKLVASTFYFSR